MKVKKVLARFAAAPEDRGELRRVARALGNELPRHRLEILRSFRAGMARIARPGDTYASGYVDGLLDVTAEYEVHVRESADARELARTALREEWRDALVMLAQGPKLPSELAASLGKDRPSVTRMLKRLRAAGLVQVYSSDALDGRRRPHRLTVQGRRLLDSLGSQDRGALPDDVASGIAVAIKLFRHLVTHPTSSAADLDAIAKKELSDPDKASSAVGTWVEECKRGGLISEFDQSQQSPQSPQSQPAQAPATELQTDLPPSLDRADTRQASSQPDTAQSSESSAPQRIPTILNELQKRDPQVPVFVRTNDEAWGAWAYALQDADTTGVSRIIANGDILSRSVEPPAQRFDLVYDSPEALATDRSEPAMRAFWEQAHEKYVVTTASEEVPEGFIQLNLTPEKE